MATPPPLDIGQISLRRNERGFVGGGTEVGKSTLADLLGADFVHRYAHLQARELILDSKPRFRAEATVQGVSAKRRYRNWDHGPIVKGSVVVDDPEMLELAWSLGYRRVIVQSDNYEKDLDRMLATVEEFLRSSRARRPQLLLVDETMDWYFPNGAPKGGNDAIVRSARTYRERGTAGLYCSQRTRNIPAQLLSEMLRLYAFRLDAKQDASRYQEFGAPPFALPHRDREFMYWYKRDYDRVWGPYRLAMPSRRSA